MRVEIESVEQGGGDGVVVAFRCVHGRGVATWSGPLPVVGDVRFVELALVRVGELVWGVTVWDLGPGAGPASLRADTGGVEIVGEVAEVWPEGTVDLQLGGNARLVVEIDGDAPRVGAWLRLQAPGLHLCDCNL